MECLPRRRQETTWPTVRNVAGRRSADFQSAVSRICNPQMRPGRDRLPAGSRRYSRLETCATQPGESVPLLGWEIYGLRMSNHKQLLHSMRMEPLLSCQRPDSHQHSESRFQRSADKPRALPWAGMTDAVGVSSRPAAPHVCRTRRGPQEPRLKRPVISAVPSGLGALVLSSQR